MKNVRPPLKWAGGKYQIVNKIREQLPKGNRLIEPFVGSGVVFLNSSFQRYTVNDLNEDLIAFYRSLKKLRDTFISRCKPLFTPENNAAERYYELRDEFNSTTDKERKSAIFLYINKHGYNGLCRYNASGEFNVPFGRYRKPYFPEKELRLMASKLQKTAICCQDFESVMRNAEPGDVVYCDPPYVPLSDTSNFTSYSAGGFRNEDQIRLARVAKDISTKGVAVLISNHRTRFTRDIYRDATRTSFLSVRRLISCNGSKRELAQELLALYLPDTPNRSRSLRHGHTRRPSK
jgi:DNA adenine methylase